MKYTVTARQRTVSHTFEMVGFTVSISFDPFCPDDPIIWEASKDPSGVHSPEEMIYVFDSIKEAKTGKAALDFMKEFFQSKASEVTPKP